MVYKGLVSSVNKKTKKTKNFDVSLVISKLNLTYEERINQHQSALNLFKELKKAHSELYGKSKRTS